MNTKMQMYASLKLLHIKILNINFTFVIVDDVTSYLFRNKTEVYFK